MELLQLLELWLEASDLHLMVESLHGEFKWLERVVGLNQVAEPFADLGFTGLVSVSMVYEEYRAIVLYMTDDAANSLVDSASGLLAVPLATSKVVFAD